MKNDAYHIVTVKDGKSDTAAIVALLNDMASGRLEPDISLLNYHNEVPVNYTSPIKSVKQDKVELLVHENQAVIMKKDKSTLIKSRHFQDGLSVHCYAAHVSVPKKTVILHDFTYAHIRAERREAVRVRVNDLLPVKFSYGGEEIKGSILHISGTGISFYSSTPPALGADQRGILSFAIMGVPLDINSCFVRAVGDSDHHFYIFRIQPDPNSESVINRFIHRRQVEVIQEIKDCFLTEDYS